VNDNEYCVSCENCVYWRKISGQEDVGECRRYAPKPTVYLEVIHGEDDESEEEMIERCSTVFPPVPAHYDCGEFKPCKAHSQSQ